MEVKFNSFMDLARYMVKQENKIRDLKQENYELGLEKLRLEQKIKNLEDARYTLVDAEVTE